MWANSLHAKYLFFTGKGGVGKTSLACATSVYLAGETKRVLLVSTDPASNLDEVLGLTLASEPTAVPGVRGLFALNIDPEEAARQYRERAISPYRGILPEAAIASMEEQFSGACTTEIAAFDEFTTLLGSQKVADEFDHIVFDTAPTGHTLRLLSLPAAWSGFIDASTTGVSCLGPLASLKAQEAVYKSSLEALKDAERTLVVLVARADIPSLKEASRASNELAYLGVSNQRLIVNGVFTPADPKDPIAIALSQRGERALEVMPVALQALPKTYVPLLAKTVVGLEALRDLLRAETQESFTLPSVSAAPASESFASLIDEIAQSGHGLIMTMGKGGVGKTTLAATIAIALAERGENVLLTTTDPASHVQDAVTSSVENLEIARINPELEVEKYRMEVMLTAGQGLDEDGRALLEEDLRSPCTEEIAVFRAFAKAVDRATERFVICDTAPTGHTILLLDAAQAYHREVSRTHMEIPESVRKLLPRLRDPNFTKVILVTLPEPTPVHEAIKLQGDLLRAQIAPFAWVVNQSFSASKTRDPLLLTKAGQEKTVVEELRHVASKLVILPWKAEPLERTSHSEAEVTS